MIASRPLTALCACGHIVADHYLQADPRDYDREIWRLLPYYVRRGGCSIGPCECRDQCIAEGE